MYYGQLPLELGTYKVECKEMMFYQYLPIKLKSGFSFTDYEDRLNVFRDLILQCTRDFIDTFGQENYNQSYIYLTVKHMYQAPNTSFNRMGWHSDGFMTDDINYIWCDKYPTIFNDSKFELTLDDEVSLKEMDIQALPINDKIFGENKLLRLNQYCIHKVAPVTEGCMRTFFKLSFSKDKYDLIGNSHNYNLNYNWKMRDRKVDRNIPQLIK